MNRILKVHPDDNVLVALSNLSAGESVKYNGTNIILADNIPAKHKFVVSDLHPGDPVIMYGVLVGKAQSDIPKGGIINTANVKHAVESYAYRGIQYQWRQPDVSKFRNRRFNGFHRSDGKVGTANYWLFIPLVFCENRNLDVIKESLLNELGYAVTAKYKSYTHELIDAYKNGVALDEVEFAPASVEQLKERRVFKNVD